MTENMNTNNILSNEEIETIYRNDLFAWRNCYFAHGTGDINAEDVSDTFINRLARDASRTKEPLREIFRKSEWYCPEHDCLVIDGKKDREPNMEVIGEIFGKWFDPIKRNAFNKVQVDEISYEEYETVFEEITAINKFFGPGWGKPETEEDLEEYGKKLNEFFPKAYAKGKKKSKVLMKICKDLGIFDPKAGSEFQHDYAIVADELSAKTVGFKLIVSINPAHFVSMSNPKYDDRGSTLTSCHSFNCTDYEYNNGCSGYARDEVTMIAFTVKDTSDYENWLNRKTSRQLFFYKPGSGILVQSRYYGLDGGTSGRQAVSKVYRELIQAELSKAENVPNLWKTSNLTESNSFRVVKGPGFGGYPDWEYSHFDPRLSIRNGADPEQYTLAVGTNGLCIQCGEETYPGDGLYCDDCDCDSRCDECGDATHEDYLTWAYDEWHNEVQVCEHCLDNHYHYCEECQEYHHESHCTYVEGIDGWVCDECRDRYYRCCEHCNEWYHVDDVQYVESEDEYVCNSCLEDDFVCCEICGEWYLPEDTTYIESEGINVCNDCCERNFVRCEVCDEYHRVENCAYVESEDRWICENCLNECNAEEENEEVRA